MKQKAANHNMTAFMHNRGGPSKRQGHDKTPDDAHGQNDISPEHGVTDSAEPVTAKVLVLLLVVLGWGLMILVAHLRY